MPNASKSSAPTQPASPGAVPFEEALKKLEALVHPAVARERQAFIDAHGEKPLVVLDIPLLFEKGGDALVDKIAVVSAEAPAPAGEVRAGGRR